MPTAATSSATLPRTRRTVPPELSSFYPALIFAVSALLAVVPLMVHGCSCGHDFDFHLQSWMEAAAQWQHGVLKPVWAFTPAYQAGEPRLLMYPPLAWATGGLIGLLLPWSAAPSAFTWFVLFLCGLSMHRLLRRWTSPAVATLGGCLYLVNPYMLFVAYERTAYAELLAAAWMPLLLAAMLRSRISVWRVAVAVALLWLTNAPAAVVGCYSVLLLGVARLVLMRREGAVPMLRVAARVAAGVGMGLLLDAFYLVPMANGRRFVQLALAIVPMARPDANFLFLSDNDAFHTHVLLQASWIAVGTLSTALLCGVGLLYLERRHAGGVQAFSSMQAREQGAGVHTAMRGAVLAMLGYSVIVCFLLTRWSTPVWHVAPELVFLQFPWRFLSMQSAVMLALFTLLLDRVLRRTRPLPIALAGVSIALIAGYFAGGTYFRESCGDYEMVPAQRSAFLGGEGTDPTDEYTPVTANNDELHLHLPPAWIAPNAVGYPSGALVAVHPDRPRTEDMHFTTPAMPKLAFLVVRLRVFPGWHAVVDGEETLSRRRIDGLMVVPLRAGRGHSVEVVYRTTPDEWAGIAISGATVLGWAVYVRRRRSGIMRQPA